MKPWLRELAREITIGLWNRGMVRVLGEHEGEDFAPDTWPPEDDCSIKATSQYEDQIAQILNDGINGKRQCGVDMKSALIVVDIQRDFCEGGSLAVPGSLEIVPVINTLLKETSYFDLVVFTQDWHPPNHKSFAENHKGKKPMDQINLHGKMQTLWPTHCVQKTQGAEFHPDLKIPPTARITIVRKGMNPEYDSYSGFKDAGGHKTTLAGILKDNKVTTIYVCGLATDYCVKATALDALEITESVYLIQNACRGVNIPKGTINEALAEMKKAGVKFFR